MDKTIKISSEDYKMVKDYTDKTFLSIKLIIHKALKIYFADKKLKE